MSGRPERLAKALGRAMRELDMGARVLESRAMALWPDVVGEVTAGRTRPLHVNRGTLVVAVASSAWANQLNLLKARYLKAFAERVGPDVVRDLRWRVLDPAQADVENFAGFGAEPRPGVARAPAPALSEAEQAAVAREVAAIADPKLAARMHEVLSAQAARRKRLQDGGWVPCERCGVLHDVADRPYARFGVEDPVGAAHLCPPCRFSAAHAPPG